MKIPISQRLLCCASLVKKGAKVADIGCDHGYLGIWLLKEQIAQSVAACDLRPQPLEKAKENAAIYGTADNMTFAVADGLDAVAPGSVDTIVCAGMGGDCIAHILDCAPWVRDPTYTLILQPQTSGNDLRRYLGETSFSIEKEVLVQDSGFLYFTARQRIMTATANSTMNNAVQSHGIAACTTVIPLLHADTARKTEAPIKMTEATVTMMFLMMSGLNSARRAAAAMGTSRSRIIVISSGEYICITEL